MVGDVGACWALMHFHSEFRTGFYNFIRVSTFNAILLGMAIRNPFVMLVLERGHINQ
jgi:hypothetical protein